MLKEPLLRELEAIVGKPNVLTSPESLKAYSYDGTTSWIHEPDVVVFPTTAEEISSDHEDRQQREDTGYPQGRRHQRQRRFRPHPGWHRPLHDEDEQDPKDRQGELNGYRRTRRGPPGPNHTDSPKKVSSSLPIPRAS